MFGTFQVHARDLKKGSEHQYIGGELLMKHSDRYHVRPSLSLQMKVTSLPFPPASNPASSPTGPRIRPPAMPHPKVPATRFTDSSLATSTA